MVQWARGEFSSCVRGGGSIPSDVFNRCSVFPVVLRVDRNTQKWRVCSEYFFINKWEPTSNNISQKMSLVDTPEVDVAFRRAEWIGYGVLWPRAMLKNAGAWSPQENREYQAAFDAQKKDIEEAIAQETPDMKCRRMRDAAICTRYVPGPADDVFDAYLAIAEVQSKVFYQKGMIMALGMARQPNDTLLEQSKQEFSVLKREKELLLEEFWTLYPEHLERNGMRIFKRQDKRIAEDGVDNVVDVDATVRDLGKRTIGETKSEQQLVDWLTADRLSVGIAILGSE